MAYADQGYTGPNAAEAAQSHGIRLEVVKHPMSKRGFVLLPRRWVVEKLRMGCSLPPTRARLQAARHNTQGVSLRPLRMPHDRQHVQTTRMNFITGSRSMTVQ